MSDFTLTGRYCFTSERRKVGLLGRLFGATGKEQLVLLVEVTGRVITGGAGYVDSAMVKEWRRAATSDLNDPALSHLVNPPYNKVTA